MEAILHQGSSKEGSRGDPSLPYLCYARELLLHFWLAGQLCESVEHFH